MATKTDTRLLFVPYRPSRSATVKHHFSTTDADVSLQKHAAREYHRKAKLERLAKALSHAAPQRQGCMPSKEASHGEAENAGSESDSHDSASARRNLPGRNTNAFRMRGSRVINNYPSLRDVGVGQMDPFNVLVLGDKPRYVQEMLDHALTYQWPSFCCSTIPGTVGEMKHAVLASTMRSPAAYYTIVFASAAHNAFLHTGMPVMQENRVLRLTYKSLAIKAVRQEIASVGANINNVTDELLLSMAILAAHDLGDTLAPRSDVAATEREDSTLLTAQNFHFYGTMDFEMAHLDAIRALIEKRGGFLTLQIDFLSNFIAIADCIVAFRRLSAPTYPMRIPTSVLQAMWPPGKPDEQTLRPFLRDLATGFDSLPLPLGSPLQLQRSQSSSSFSSSSSSTSTSSNTSMHALYEAFFQVIPMIRKLSISYDLYLRKDDSAPPFPFIMWGRNCLIHECLSLPDMSGRSRSAGAAVAASPRAPELLGLTADSCQYELCRLGTLGYMLLVLFPYPRVSGLHLKLAQRISQAVEDYVTTTTSNDQGLYQHQQQHQQHQYQQQQHQYQHQHQHQQQCCPDLLLWVTVIGGVLSDPTSFMRSWFEEFFVQTISTDRPALRASWAATKDVCAKFLWFESDDCDGEGQVFWADAMATRLTEV